MNKLSGAVSSHLYVKLSHHTSKFGGGWSHNNKHLTAKGHCHSAVVILDTKSFPDEDAFVAGSPSLAGQDQLTVASGHAAAGVAAGPESSNSEESSTGSVVGRGVVSRKIAERKKASQHGPTAVSHMPAVMAPKRLPTTTCAVE